jgi:aminobenzoyl-glutamate utilization protein B
MTRVIRFAAVLLTLVALAAAFPRLAGPDAKATAFAAIDRNKDEIAKVGDAIYSFAELGMQEIETTRLCAQLLKDMGYRVETGISGIPTAILATYGRGTPVIAIHVEHDALPNGSQAPGVTDRQEIVKGAPGHAEGHNTNAALWIGAAFAIRQAIDEHHLGGTIKLFSAPAEE